MSRSRSRLAVAAATTLTLGVIRIAAPAQVHAAGIVKVQAGPVATNLVSGSVTPTLPAASTAGDLLVATLASGSGSAAFGAPAGWTQGPVVGLTGSRSEIWYMANSPAGITSAAFSASGAVGVDGQLSEWSGVATTSPLDQTGTATATAATQLTVSTTTATGTAGELAIAAFDESLAVATTLTFTPGMGWTNLGNSSTGGAAVRASTADYQLGLPVGVVSETETSNGLGIWSGVIATFKPTVPCSGGSLTLTAPAAVSVGATLSGVDQSTITNAQFIATDNTGTASGWSIAGTSTLFGDAGGHTLPATATTVTGASATAGAGNCSLPTNTVSYPTTLPAGASAPAPVRIYDSAAGTGTGATNVALTFSIALPANTLSGTYTSTWTFSVSSGP